MTAASSGWRIGRGTGRSSTSTRRPGRRTHRQAGAFRDGIAAIHAEGADVFGISTDTIESQAAFHEEEHLPFTLLADSRAR